MNNVDDLMDRLFYQKFRIAELSKGKFYIQVRAYSFRGIFKKEVVEQWILSSPFGTPIYDPSCPVECVKREPLEAFDTLEEAKAYVETLREKELFEKKYYTCDKKQVIPQMPQEPLIRVIAENDTSFCKLCGSGIKSKWLFFKGGCRNERCRNYKC